MAGHSPWWSQDVHGQPMWKCNREELHDSEALFSTPDHFLGHVRALHPEFYSTLDESSFIALAEKSVSDPFRPPDTCPLCCLTHLRTSIKNHIAEHLQNLMVLSLRLVEIQDPELYPNSEVRSMNSDRMSLASQVNHFDPFFDLDKDDFRLSLNNPSGTRPETPILDHDKPPDTDIQDWSFVTEKMRQQHPEWDRDVDLLMGHLGIQRRPSSKSTIRQKNPVKTSKPKLKQPMQPTQAQSSIRRTSFVSDPSRTNSQRSGASESVSQIYQTGHSAKGKQRRISQASLGSDYAEWYHVLGCDTELYILLTRKVHGKVEDRWILRR
jgi:hypothetical protein